MKFVVFKDARGEYRWKLVARNGRSVAVSGEGFKRKHHAAACVRLIRGYPRVVDQTT
jgi:uncharacterized protein YegP (UPF0339 family)